MPSPLPPPHTCLAVLQARGPSSRGTDERFRRAVETGQKGGRSLLDVPTLPIADAFFALAPEQSSTIPTSASQPRDGESGPSRDEIQLHNSPTYITGDAYRWGSDPLPIRSVDPWRPAAGRRGDPGGARPRGRAERRAGTRAAQADGPGGQRPALAALMPAGLRKRPCPPPPAQGLHSERAAR